MAVVERAELVGEYDAAVRANASEEVRAAAAVGGAAAAGDDGIRRWRSGWAEGRRSAGAVGGDELVVDATGVGRAVVDHSAAVGAGVPDDGRRW